jgi:hypothetical protein
MPETELSLLFLSPLNRMGIRYIVSGSIASILYGEPRFTNDLDLVVFLRHDDIQRLVKAFPAPDFYVPPVEVIAVEVARELKGQFNVIHSGTGFKADFYTTGRDEFNAWAFRNARKMDFMGELVTVAPPEYVIVRKLEYFREGGSEKHLRDIRAMLAVSAEQIDRTVLEELIQQRGLENEWQKIKN